MIVYYTTVHNNYIHYGRVPHVVGITHFRGLHAGKIQYEASALPQPRIVFCLHPSEVGYN